MAYLHQSDPRGRAAAIGGVVAVHTALALGLVLGLQVTGMLEKRTKLTGETFTPLPPPKPPEPAKTPPRQPQETKLVVPTPPTPLPTNNGVTVEPFDPFANAAPGPFVGPSQGDDKLVIPTPSPSPSYAPKGVVPKGSPANWISTDDYPSGALRRGEEGMTGYRLVVASDGTVSACEVVRKSGSADLDREACRLLTRRARFEPATDDSGARVVGTYSGSVRWDIPD